MSLNRTLLPVVAALLAPLAAASADDVYWLTSDASGATIIRRADVEILEPVTLVEGAYGASRFAVCRRTNRLYWTGTDRILRSDLDGQGIDAVLETSGRPDQLAVSEEVGLMAWVEDERDIWVADLDGSRARSLLGGRRNPKRLTVDGRRNALYFVEVTGPELSWTLFCAPLSGDRPEIVASGLAWPVSIELDDVVEGVAAVYVVGGDEQQSRLERIDLATGAVNTIIEEDGFITAAHVDAQSGRLYWSPRDGGSSTINVRDAEDTEVTTFDAAPATTWDIAVERVTLEAPLSFASVRGGGGVVSLSWRTTAEPGRHQFNVYRALAPAFLYTKVNRQPIQPQGVRRTYRFDDTSVVAGHRYHYRLETVDSITGGFSFTELGWIEVSAPQPALLLQSAPNPFSSTTVITFELAGTSPVALRVHDAGGRQVRTLVRGNLQLGRYDIEWDGRNTNGAKLAAGVYFYVLETAGRVDTGKLLLLRE